MDLDFGYLLAIGKYQLPSIILFRLNNETSEVINKRLMDVIENSRNSFTKGVIVSVDELRHRIRELPIEK